MSPDIAYNMFQFNTECASQNTMPTKRRLKFLFLVTIHDCLHVPSIIPSLPGNCTATCRYPVQIINSCSKALTPDLLFRLKHSLRHHNPSKRKVHVTVEKCREARVCGNHASVSKHLSKVESTLNKEEWNTYVIFFPSWLEHLFPNMFLTPQGLMCKPEKKTA